MLLPVRTDDLNESLYNLTHKPPGSDDASPKLTAAMSSPESQDIWTRSDAYHNSFLIPEDDVLNKISENSKASGLRNVAVTAAQGKFLHLVALSIGARRILEVGTLGG